MSTLAHFSHFLPRQLMEKMAYVVDFQAFKSLSNEFILKEMAIVSVHTSTIHHFSVKPTFPLRCELKKRVEYIKANIHNIPWVYGDIEIEKALDYLNDVLKDATIVYVKGSERAEYLRKNIIGNVKVIDLDKLGCPQARFLPSTLLQVCMYSGHYRTNYRCALKNAQKYKQWLLL